MAKDAFLWRTQADVIGKDTEAKRNNLRDTRARPPRIGQSETPSPQEMMVYCQFPGYEYVCSSLPVPASQPGGCIRKKC
jgi:hypothetical protein